MDYECTQEEWTHKFLTSISLDDLCVSIRIFMKFRLVIILTAFLGGLTVMHYYFAPKNNDAVTQPQVEGVSSSEINRSPPSALRRKMLAVPALEQHAAPRVESKERMSFLLTEEKDIPEISLAELASEKNQVMDELLNQPQVPSDYADVMIGLYRDKTQDVLTRDFAVQHIGLYAQALNRRGEYDAASAESQKLRLALFDAAGETRTIVAAAAFRALSDMSAFDSRIDAGRLDSLLAACTADASSDPASRAMAVQLCGERRVRPSRPALEAISGIPSIPAVLRLSARRALALIDGKELAQ